MTITQQQALEALERVYYDATHASFIDRNLVRQYIEQSTAQPLNAELVARVEGLEKDAARYRHLRGHRGMEHDSFAVHSTLTDDLLWGDDLDHEIDRIAAIAARSGT